MSNHYGENCKGGCGAQVNNRIGLCRKCRAKECIRCKKTFHANMVDSDICGNCMNKSKGLTRTNKSWNNRYL